MSCDEFEIAIERRARGALTTEENAALSAHLASCESCRRFESSVSAITQSLHRHGVAETGGIDVNQLRQKIDRLAKGHRVRFAIVVVVPIAAVLATFFTNRSIDGTSGAMSPVIASSLVMIWIGVSALLKERREVAAMGRGEGDILAWWRTRLDERIRATRLISVVFPLMGLILLSAALFLPGLRNHVIVIGGWLMAGLFSIAGLWQAWLCVRLRRERASLG